MLFSESSAKIVKDQKVVALYPKAQADPSWRIPTESTRLSSISHGVTSKISSTNVVSPKSKHSGGSPETEISENIQNIEKEIICENTFEIGTANAVIRHQMNSERVQWHHATFGFPFTSTFVKALNRDFHDPGLTQSTNITNQISWSRD